MEAWPVIYMILTTMLKGNDKQHCSFWKQKRETLKRYSRLILCKFYNFITSFIGLLNYQLRHIQKQVVLAINDANINDVPDIDQLFGDVSSVGPFVGLETEYRQRSIHLLYLYLYWLIL